MQNLGILAGGTKSFAYSANQYGSAISGEADWVGDESSGDRAFRWTASTGMRNLGVPPGTIHSYGYVISGDGQVVAGRAKLSSGAYRACLWTNMIGMVDLQNYLATQGLTLPGWTLTEARGLSADGSAISGTGVFGGQNRAFLVRGVAVPSMAIINRYPIERTTGPGGTVVFDTEADGNPVYQWQWRSLDGPIPTPWTEIIDGPNGDSTGGVLFIATGARSDNVAVTNTIGTGATGTSSRREVRVVASNEFNSETSPAAAWTTCYANCDTSNTPPVLNANDFQCFLNKFAENDPYANCDGSTVDPLLNANDFQCFLNAFALGCP
jgi:probable HAF family extracellular repeat protein